MNGKKREPTAGDREQSKGYIVLVTKIQNISERFDRKAISNGYLTINLYNTIFFFILFRCAYREAGHSLFAAATFAKCCISQ